MIFFFEMKKSQPRLISLFRVVKSQTRLIFSFWVKINRIVIDFLILKLKIKHRFVIFIFEAQNYARSSQNFRINGFKLNKTWYIWWPKGKSTTLNPRNIIQINQNLFLWLKKMKKLKNGKKRHSFKILRVKIKNFLDKFYGKGQIDYEESVDRGPESLRYILWAPGSKTQ